MTACATIHCDRCHVSWRSPVDLPEAVWARIGSLRRLDRSMDAIAILHSEVGLSVADAKAIILHMASEPGRCHRCAAALDGRKVTTCTACGSVNYDP